MFGDFFKYIVDQFNKKLLILHLWIYAKIYAHTKKTCFEFCNYCSKC